jgi:hypothetical protein
MDDGFVSCRASEYREIARACVKAALRMRHLDARAQLFDLALHWLSFAEQVQSRDEFTLEQSSKSRLRPR